MVAASALGADKKQSMAKVPVSFLCYFVMTDVVQEDATTACQCDCRLPLACLLLTI